MEWLTKAKAIVRNTKAPNEQWAFSVNREAYVNGYEDGLRAARRGLVFGSNTEGYLSPSYCMGYYDAYRSVSPGAARLNWINEIRE